MEQLDKKEVFNSMAKSIFSIIPFAGTAITELVFEYNGRIRQNPPLTPESFRVFTLKGPDL